MDNYEEKYKKYKSKYLDLKNSLTNLKDIIFINSLPGFDLEKITDLFSTKYGYNLIYLNDRYIQSPLELLKIIMEQNLQGDKVAVVGSLYEPAIIDNIFGSPQNFDMIVVKPDNVEKYQNQVLKKFETDPESYGHIDWLHKLDSNGLLLQDYYLHRNQSQIVKNIIPYHASNIYQEIHNFIMTSHYYYNIYEYNF